MVYSQPNPVEPKRLINPKWLMAFGALLFLVLLLFIPGNRQSNVALSQDPQSYIVQGESMAAVKALVEAQSGLVTSELDIIDGVGAMLTPADAEKLAEIEGVIVTPNYSVVSIQSLGGDEEGASMPANHWTPAADYSEVVQADVAWDAGITGDNVTVAVLDTGIDPSYAGLRFNTQGEKRLIMRKKANFIENDTLPLDEHGHGTHIAGIIANSDVEPDGDWFGVAPDVNLLPVKVLNAEGAGTYESVILGIQYTIKKRNKFNVKVMNLSLVSPVQSPYWADPLNQAVTVAWSSGIAVVAAAGNEGAHAMSISVPGNNPYAITVGAFTDSYTPDDPTDDYITPFSAAGPTLDGFVKPDVVAPGAHIYSTLNADSTLAQLYPDNFYDPNYFTSAGTSQATAVTSGVIALMIQQNTEAVAEYKAALAEWREIPKEERDRDDKPARVKKLKPNHIKYRLQHTSQVWVDPETNEPLYSIWQQGFGRVDASSAVFSTEFGNANRGMKIRQDIKGKTHYEGYSSYDEETGLFVLYEDPAGGGFGSWAGQYTAWDGNYSPETGGFGSWAGGFGSWAGGFGSWAGGFGSWAGGFGSWAGGFGSWAGGFGSWAGGFGSWAGSYGDADFAADFVLGNPPDASTSSASIGNVIEYED